MLHLLAGFTDASRSPNRQSGQGIRETPTWYKFKESIFSQLNRVRLKRDSDPCTGGDPLVGCVRSSAVWSVAW